MNRIAALLMLAMVGLAGCTTAATLPGESIANPATAPVEVSPQAAARLLSEMRAAEGLGAVVVSPRLNAIAEDYADVLAAAGRVEHDIGGSLGGRLADGGYVWVVAAENLGGGYRSLDEAFDRWYESRSHRANLLAPGVTEIGIATSFNIASPYRTFWVLLLGRPAG